MKKLKYKKILKFEYPKTFKVNKSLLLLRFKRNHILDIKIIKGNNLIIILGIYKAVKIKGFKIYIQVFKKLNFFK